MKRFFLICGLFILTAFLAASQTIKPAEAPHDTIFKINGQRLPVDVTTVTPTYISFVLPGKPDEFTIERKEVHKIIYKTGKIDILNQAAFQMLDESSWEAVWVTEEKKDISSDLYMLGEIDANSPSSSRSAAAANKGAIIKLKKKAANMKGNIILVTKKQATGGYGEYPGYYIKGIVYGTEPPEQAGGTTTNQSATVKDAGM